MVTDPNDVKSREDLVAFLDYLVTDLNGPRAEIWANNDLESFLDALSRTVLSLKGWARNQAPNVDPEQASWRVFAVALWSATVYE